MKVILLRDVASLGKEGTVVEVSDGHARNFLFPQNMGISATPDALRKMREKDEVKKRSSHKELSVIGDLARRIDGYEVLLQEKVSDGGTLYGAITPKMIVKALKKSGFKVKEDMIQLPDPIKEPGETMVTLSLPHGFEVEVRVVIEGK